MHQFSSRPPHRQHRLNTTIPVYHPSANALFFRSRTPLNTAVNSGGSDGAGYISNREVWGESGSAQLSQSLSLPASPPGGRAVEERPGNPSTDRSQPQSPPVCTCPNLRLPVTPPPGGMYPWLSQDLVTSGELRLLRGVDGGIVEDGDIDNASIQLRHRIISDYVARYS